MEKTIVNSFPNNVLFRKKEGFGFPIEIYINKYKHLYFDYLL